MSMEQRRLRMHEDLLYSVIQRQAGTLGKAVLEGVMNSIDAGADRCDILLTEHVLRIDDNGRGFSGVEAVDKFFEVFGQPHSEGEKKVYGAFRMGRGQLFAFGENMWRTGKLEMNVDIKNRGLDYTRGEKDGQDIKGCEIKVDLYQRLLPSGVQEVKKEVCKLVKYVPVIVTLNGERISVDLSQQKWDHDTPEAWIKLRDTGDLEVYNLGVLVRGYSNEAFGTGGVVVSKKQLKVNFARNDVMQSECEVWRKIRKFVNQKATESNTRKEVLSDGSRARLAQQLVDGELEAEEGYKLKLLTDVSGRHWSIWQLSGQIRRHEDRMTCCERGNHKGDAIHQAKLAFVMAEETLNIFGCGSVKALLKLFAKVEYEARGYRSCFAEVEAIGFGELAGQFNDTHKVLPSSEWTPKESAVVSAAEREGWRIRAGLGEENPYSSQRKIVIGLSGTASGWTDGETYIAIERKWLERHLNMGMDDCVYIASLLLHEYCHDEADSGSHLHSPEFYERFHEASLNGAVAFAAENMFSRACERFEQEGRVLSKKAMKIKDKMIRNAEAQKALSEAEQKVAALAAPKPAAPKAEAKPEPSKPASGNLYRGKYGILFEEASNWISLDDLLGRVSRRTGQTKEQVKIAFDVLGNHKHKSNKGRSERQEKDGLVKLVAK